MTKNQLKIEASSLDLELTGDADYVADAYGAMRSVIVERFQQTLREEEANTRRPTSEKAKEDRESRPKGRKTEPTITRLDPDSTNPLFKIDDLRKRADNGELLIETQLQFVVCTSLYRRVAALSRDDFSNSIFGKVIEPEALSKVYIGEGAATCLRDHIEFGKTLWRELTNEGQAMIHGDSS